MRFPSRDDLCCSLSSDYFWQEANEARACLGMKAEQLPAPVISQKAVECGQEAAEHVAPAVALLSPEQCLWECKAQPSPDTAADPWGALSPSSGAEQAQSALDRVHRAQSLWSWKHNPGPAHGTDSVLPRAAKHAWME